MTIIVVISTTKVADPAPRIAQRLGRRNHVERHRQSAALVDVVQPQFGPRKLPLHVTVLLMHVIDHIKL